MSSLEINLGIILPKQNSLNKRQAQKYLPKRSRKPSEKREKNLKEKKATEDALLINHPNLTSVDELMGKRMQHLTFDYRGREKSFPGVVICQKSDSDNKLVICYDFDYKLHYLNVSCFENFAVKLTPTYLLGNPIRKIFIKIEENDF